MLKQINRYNIVMEQSARTSVSKNCLMLTEVAGEAMQFSSYTDWTID